MSEKEEKSRLGMQLPENVAHLLQVLVVLVNVCFLGIHRAQDLSIFDAYHNAAAVRIFFQLSLKQGEM